MNLQKDNNFLLEKMFDLIRMVDPEEKRVIDVVSNKKIDGCHCYDNWKNNRICTNCISMRAYQTGKVVVKVEYDEEKIYLAMATPFKDDGSKYVIETLKDVTNSGIIVDADKKDISELKNEIENLNRLVVTDDLTGCYNRRFIDEHLAADIVNSFETGKNLSIILFDIDFFKRINDKFGHTTGDDVLKQLAALISDCICEFENSWVARFGGEEFLVALYADSNRAAELGETIRNNVEEKGFRHGLNCVSITLSAGIASLYGKLCEPQQLIDIADRKLYDAKQRGRNKVVR